MKRLFPLVALLSVHSLPLLAADAVGEMELGLWQYSYQTARNGQSIDMLQAIAKTVPPEMRAELEAAGQSGDITKRCISAEERETLRLDSFVAYWRRNDDIGDSQYQCQEQVTKRAHRILIKSFSCTMSGVPYATGTVTATAENAKTITGHSSMRTQFGFLTTDGKPMGGPETYETKLTARWLSPSC